jgi:hypothetical protein
MRRKSDMKNVIWAEREGYDVEDERHNLLNDIKLDVSEVSAAVRTSNPTILIVFRKTVIVAFTI